MPDAARTVIDTEQLGGLAEAAGAEGVRAILDAFWSSTKEISDEISSAISSEDTESLGKLSHALKGSSANVGAALLAERAKAIEEAARAGDVDTVREALADFVAAISTTQTEVDVLLARYD